MACELSHGPVASTPGGWRCAWAWRCLYWVMSVSVGVMSVSVGTCQADEFLIRDDALGRVTISGREVGKDVHFVAIERDDGRLELVPHDRLLKQMASPPPEPITCEKAVERLRDEFGEERVIAVVDKPYVVCLVRSSRSAPGKQELKEWEGLLAKAAKFLKSMQQQFLDFVRGSKVAIQPVKYPLVVLIFDTDEAFEEYATIERTRQGVPPGVGISAANMAGYYNALTNRLYLRVRECTTFETPLHEAIHQQTYNRGIIQRMAPVPKWFVEGMATGFEGDGKRVKSGPRTARLLYTVMSLSGDQLDWSQVVSLDAAFQGDVLAAEAYGHAWGIHWLLVTKYRSEYNALVRHYSTLKTLQAEDESQRVVDFKNIVGKTPGELQAEFQSEVLKALGDRGDDLRRAIQRAGGNVSAKPRNR